MTGNDLTNAAVSGFNDIMRWLETLPCRFGWHSWRPDHPGRALLWKRCQRCDDLRVGGIR